MRQSSSRYGRLSVAYRLGLRHIFALLVTTNLPFMGVGADRRRSHSSFFNPVVQLDTQPAKTTRTEVMATARKLSGLQKDVLSLYRSLLRVAAQKDRAEGQHIPITTLFTSIGGAGETTTTSHARAEFRQQCAEVKRSDFRTIEYLIRKGRKHVKLLQMPGVKGTSSFGGGAR